MASGQGKDSESDRAKMMRVLVPAVAISAIVLLVAVIVGISDGLGQKMVDGSNGGADDPDLKEIEPGVKYRDLKEGTGEACPKGADVNVYYKGWLPNGNVFDSKQRKDGITATFNLGEGVIKGWQVGIPGMKPGGIRKLVIAPEMGYGREGFRDLIPGGSTLIFEVELVSATPIRKSPTANEKPADEGAKPTESEGSRTEGPGKPMSDNSDGGTGDPGLKDIGRGLKIRDLKEGSGDPVRALANVTVHYTGWLANGKVFDSSKNRGKAFTTALDGVVEGWKKGIPGMKPGGIRKIVIPPELGYGQQRMGNIPPNSTLIFEVELIRVN